MAKPSALAVLRLMTSSNLASWMIGRSPGFSPLRILPSVDALLTVCLGEAGSVADQAAGHRELALLVDGRNGMARCQRGDPIAPAIEEWIGGDEERSRPSLHDFRKGRFDLGLAPGLEDSDFFPDRSLARLRAI